MANDFSSDDNCKALWRFEDGNLDVDSKGSNTLTLVDSPASDTSIYKEGAASINLVPTDYAYVTDGDLDSGFPLKNGDTIKKFSGCVWVYIDAFPSSGNQDTIYEKNDTIIVQIYNNSGNYRFRFGTNWLGYVYIEHPTNITSGKWYHIGLTYDDNDLSYRFRIWDDDAGTLLGNQEVTGTAGGNISIGTGSWKVGVSDFLSDCLDGREDELVVFNDILTADEIDEIRAGTYSGGGNGGTTDLMLGNNF